MRNPAVRPLARSEHGNGPSSPAKAAGEQPPGTSTVGLVVVGVDDSPTGLSALRWAVDRARNGGAQLVAVRSWALGLPRHGGRLRRRPARVHREDGS
jgi:Universal stress protein family